MSLNHRTGRPQLGVALLCALAGLACAANGGLLRRDAQIERSLVRIVNHSQKADWYSPWSSAPTRQSSGSGFVIDGGFVMTNAHVVSDARMLLLYLHGDPTPHEARVVSIAHDCDLALLEPVEAGLLDESEAIHHEDRHVVSNVLGSPNMHIEVGSVLHLKLRDTVLLASDGIFDNLHVAEIVELIRKGPLSHVDTELAIATRSRMNGEEAHHPCKPDKKTYLLFRLGAADESARSRGDNISSTIATPTMTST